MHIRYLLGPLAPFIRKTKPTYPPKKLLLTAYPYIGLRAHLEAMTAAMTMAWGNKLGIPMTPEKDRLFGPIILKLYSAWLLGVVPDKGAILEHLKTTNDRTVTNYIDLLREAGYVTVHSSTMDRRRTLIAPTAHLINRLTDILTDWADIRHYGPAFDFLIDERPDPTPLSEEDPLYERAYIQATIATETLRVAPHCMPALIARIDALMVLDEWPLALQDLLKAEELDTLRDEVKELRKIFSSRPKKKRRQV